MKLKAMALVSVVVGLAGAQLGCSGSGGGGSSSGSTSSGVLSLPSANCGSGTCIQSVNQFETMTAGGSAETVLSFASTVYNYVQKTYVPTVNAKLAQVENAFASQGYTKCGGVTADVATGAPQINLIPDGTYTLGSGISVSVTPGDKTAPYTTTKKFVFSLASTAFLEVQVLCPSTTERAVYVRLNDGGKMYEAWGADDGSAKLLIAATDNGTARANLYFRSSSSTVFQVGAVAKNFIADSSAVPQTYTISGGADFSGGRVGLLDANLIINSPGTAMTSSNGASFAADGAAVVNAPVRHCYTNLSTYTVTQTASVCDNLFVAPPTAFIRGANRAASVWNVTDVGTTHAISTGF